MLALLAPFLLQPVLQSVDTPVHNLIVGFDGPVDTAVLIEAGGNVLRVIDEIGVAVVAADDLDSFELKMKNVPVVAFVDTDDRLLPDGSTWDGSTWDGSTWDGSTWDGSTWDGSTWDGSTWDGSTWDGSTWDGSTWDGSTWDGSTWDGSTWDGSTWDGSTWDGSTWDGSTWDGTGVPPNAPPAPPWGYEDPFYSFSWGLGAVNAPDAWQHGLGSGAVTVCVLDTGIDATHPDLEPNLWTGKHGERSLSAMRGNQGPGDDVGHGSHVAGIAGAVTGNGRGGSGVAQERILSMKVMDANGGYESDLAAGLIMCMREGAQVASMSLHVTSPSPALDRALMRAQAGGMVLVAAAGNDGMEHMPFPASHPYVLAVGAVGPDGTRAGFSNFGPGLDLVAPGVHIASTFYQGGYAVGSGTSQAVPFVSAAAAYVMAVRPDFTPTDVRTLLTGTARDLGPAGWDGDFGHGALDFGAAVNAAQGP